MNEQYKDKRVKNGGWPEGGLYKPMKGGLRYRTENG